MAEARALNTTLHTQPPGRTAGCTTHTRLCIWLILCRGWDGRGENKCSRPHTPLFLPTLLRPFRTLGTQRQVAPPPARANYCSDSDALFLEDESGRVRLGGIAALVNHFVTGAWRGPEQLQKQCTSNSTHQPAPCRLLCLPPLPAGVVVAVRGKLTESGELTVTDLRPAGLQAPKPLPALAPGVSVCACVQGSCGWVSE